MEPLQLRNLGLAIVCLRRYGGVRYDEPAVACRAADWVCFRTHCLSRLGPIVGLRRQVEFGTTSRWLRVVRQTGSVSVRTAYPVLELSYDSADKEEFGTTS